MNSMHMQKEIKYLEEEITYWMTEYQLKPDENKMNIIHKLNNKLKILKELLENENTTK